MIAKRTVFIVGAGASKPYGLPTGHELKWKIISDYDQLLRSGYSGDDFDNKLEAARQLARDFRNSGQASIDQFLSQRTDIAPLGKLLIASALLPREREAMEYRPQNGDWLARLFGYFNHLPDRIINDNNVFIVFNYDRIVELSFVSMYASSTGCDALHAAEKTNGIRVIHAYGSLTAPLSTLNHQRTLVSHETHGNVKLASDGILLISEREQFELRNTLIGTVHNASTCVFLGFGFDQANLRVLGIGPGLTNHGLPNTSVYATCIGMTPLEKYTAAEAIGKSIHDIRFGGDNDDALMLLRHHFYK